MGFKNHKSKPKGKKIRDQPSTKPKKKAQKVSKANVKLDSDEELSDVMQWGKDKANYYREDEEEYSQLSEEEHEVERIYQNQYENMNDEDLYDIGAAEENQDLSAEQNDDKPRAKASSRKKSEIADSADHQLLEDEEGEQYQIPRQYILQELQWTCELFKDLEFYDKQATPAGLFEIYEDLLRNYMSIMISLKEFRIPYAEYHPIVPLAVQMKTKIAQIMKKLVVKEDDEGEVKQMRSKFNRKEAKNNQDLNSSNFDFESQSGSADEEENSEGQFSDGVGQSDWSYDRDMPMHPDHCQNATQTQKEQHKKGLEYYKQMQQSQQLAKRQKKKLKKAQRQQNEAKPIFKQVEQDEGRFASELILKNKGLIKKRKKIDSNSRVKLRKKYEKKKALHRAQSGHFVRQNPGRAYEGEANIKYGKIHSRKLQ